MARTEKIVVPVIFPNLLLIWAVYRCYISFCFLQKNFRFFGGGILQPGAKIYYSSVHNTRFKPFSRSLWFIVFLCCFTFVLNYCFQMSSTKTYNFHIIFQSASTKFMSLLVTSKAQEQMLMFLSPYMVNMVTQGRGNLLSQRHTLISLKGEMWVSK